MNRMKTEELRENIVKATYAILKVAREKCTNHFSDNVVFVIRRFDVSDLDFNDLFKLRKATYEKARKLTIDQVVQELYCELPELLWIDLQIYESEKDRTIVEVQIVNKQQEECINNQQFILSFHAGIPTPQYAIESNERFDINWQQNTLNHRLRSFLWKI